jgi:hypothetical protein
MAWDAVPEQMVEYINPDLFYFTHNTGVAGRWIPLSASPSSPQQFLSEGQPLPSP